MKKSPKNHAHVVSITREMDKGHQIQRFLNWEKHPRQKQTPFADSFHPSLPIHIIF